MMEKRKNLVRVSSAGGGEPPVNDGHSWRKYGQKEILGAKYPRFALSTSHPNVYFILFYFIFHSEPTTSTCSFPSGIEIIWLCFWVWDVVPASFTRAEVAASALFP
jgi:hypothetical protein